MAINLTKGQRISLAKAAPNLQQLMCGLGWDVITAKKGIFGLLNQQADIDIDSSILCLDDQNQLQAQTDIIYFGNLKHKSGAITHLGDNLTGAGEGDDEQIIVNLTKIPAYIHKLVFTINIYNCLSRKQEFSQVNNAFVRLVNLETHAEIARYTLSGSQYHGCTGMILAEVYRQDDEWKMVASGEGFKAANLSEIADRYR